MCISDILYAAADHNNDMSKLERYCVTMTNGEQITIPVKKYNYIKEKLTQICNDE